MNVLPASSKATYRLVWSSCMSLGHWSIAHRRATQTLCVPMSQDHILVSAVLGSLVMALRNVMVCCHSGRSDCKATEEHCVITEGIL